MRSTITLNGKNSSEIEGLLIQSLPPISKPLIRTQIEEIDGRDGDIVTPLGFSAYTKEITIGLYGDFDINEIISYFNSEGTVTFSNEPDMYYNYQIISQIDFERLIRYRTATVSMHCQPFKYSTTEGADILSSSDNFATLDQSINTDTSFYTYTSNVQDDVTATRNGVANNGKFFAVFTIPVVQGITYYFSGNVSSKVTMYAYTDTLRGTNAGIAGKAFTGNFTYTATFTGTMVLGFYVGLATEIFIRNFFVTNETAGIISGEGNDIVLEGTTEAPFLTLTAKGDTYQQTYSGKNLLNVDFTNGNAGGLTFTYNGNSSITVSGTVERALSFSISPASADTLVLPSGKTYIQRVEILSGSLNGLSLVPSFKDSNGTIVYNYFTNNQIKTTTDTMTNYQYNLYCSAAAIGNTINVTLRAWLEEGSDPSSSFEPYVGGTASPNPDYPQDIQVVTGEQTVTVTGKNLLNPFLQHEAGWTTTNRGITFTLQNDGGINAKGTATGNALALLVGDSWGSETIQIPLDKTKTYTISIVRPNTNHRFYVRGLVNGAITTLASNVDTTITNCDGITLVQVEAQNGTTVDGTIYLQLEQGSTATAYEPYQSQSYTINLGSTELCKIGDYQDKPFKNEPSSEYYNSSLDEGAWYVHKETNKVIPDLSAAWVISNYTNVEYISFAKPLDYVSDNSFDYTPFYCTHAIFRKAPSGGWDSANNVEKGYTGAAKHYFWIGFAKGTGLDAMKTILSGMEIYYPLATPTDTKITDSTLIEELEALKNNSHAYKGRTYIKTNSTSSNLPHIIEAEVAGNMDGTVTNSGNTTARPKLTIFGSGNIGISLNGNQIFNIALGNEGHITIDTNAMEAYKDTTNNLKNRLVTGDYGNFVLQTGDNQISFSGNATMCVVENYSRWL